MVRGYERMGRRGSIVEIWLVRDLTPNGGRGGVWTIPNRLIPWVFAILKSIWAGAWSWPSINLDGKYLSGIPYPI
jgi:hypothetical protein